MERSYSDYFVKMVLGQYPKNNTYKSLGWALGIVAIISFPLAAFIRILPGLIKVCVSDKFYSANSMVKKLTKNTIHWSLCLILNSLVYIPMFDANIENFDFMDAYLATHFMSVILLLVIFMCICGKYISLLNK